ncbi:hypothetical protein NEMIN01_1873 [Nematocida minor]|uniref:uncharacterized protein n=1 Tax=Nematocida minor TaxID=1912983 RepID=UPI00221E55BE|nr:uncharacterized protein NEMIN01_1873 [Nematocida minor]KAI5192204.1 hypothetical protein NEMIN01_1873 [Nematocida minor]
MDCNILNLGRIIGSLKKQVNQQDQDMLLPYLETEQRTNMVFQMIKEEDSLGRFYCLILLEKSLNRPRTEDELVCFLDNIQYLISSIHFSSSLEISKISSLYSKAALFYWPIRMPAFISTINSLIVTRSNLCLPVLKNFMQLISDSLDITEERRYELKKSVGKIENDILVALYQHGDRVELLEVLLLMNRIEILNENIVVSFFKNVDTSDVKTVNALSTFINNLNISGNSNVFYTILLYLYSASSIDSISFISNNINIVDNTSKEIVGLVYKIITNAIVHMDKLDTLDIDTLLKVYLKLAKNYSKYFGKDVSALVPISYDVFFMSIISTVSRIDSAEEEFKSIQDSAIGILSTVSAVMVDDNTDMFRKYYTSIPLLLSEAIIKNMRYPVYTGNPYLDLKQSVLFKDFAEIGRNIGKLELKTSKECATVRESVELLVEQGVIREEEGVDLYKRCLAVNNYYAIELAVSIGVILNRDDLVLGAVQDFKGKGVVAFISIIEKCNRLVFKLFPQFKSHILNKNDEMINEIDAVCRLLDMETDRVKEGNNKYKVDALEVVGREILEKIFMRIECGVLMEIRKMTKLFPYLKERIHEVFLQKVWLRMKSELERQRTTDDFGGSAAIQNIIGSVAGECRTAEEAQILYEIVESEEYSSRGVLLGVKGVLEGSRESEYYVQVLSAMISVLVSVYVSHSDENTRASIVGIIIEKEERVRAMEGVYQIDLSEVYGAKEKRAVMKKVLRRIEGMNEKQGALLKKPKKKEGEEDRWNEITTPFM